MPRLRTLGGLSIDDAERSLRGAALQRRRLTVLAVIAGAGPKGISRDKLLGLFWPEADEDRARHSLAQTLYALRRSLHADDLFVGTADIRVNTDRLTVDAWDFEEALSSGDLARAVGLYGGPFLDGVHLDDAQEFERWMESERDRLAQAHRRALESLAVTADGAGDGTAAVRWWRELAAVDPLSLRPALGLMRALSATGDSAAAVRHARVYEALLRAELDVPLPAEIVAYLERLRQQPGAAINQGTQVITTPEPPAESTTQPAESAPQPAVALPAPKTSRMKIVVGASIVLAVVIAAIANVWSARPGSAVDASRVDANRVAILPFDSHGDSATYLRDGMVHLLSAGLDSAGDLRAVEPRVILSRLAGASAPIIAPDAAADVAATLGAGLFVLGDVTEVGGQVQITAALFNTLEPNEPIARSSVSGALGETFDLIDRVAAELLAGRLKKPGERLASVAAVSTTSLSALKAYLAGERSMQVGRHLDALEEFRKAVAVDSTFALAYYRMSVAADWAGQMPVAERAAEQAARYADRLAPHERLLVAALRSWRRNDIENAERYYKLILWGYPDDVETWYQLGEVYFHNNAARGRSIVEARAPFERVLALEPGNRDAVQHLLRIAAWEGQWDTVAAMIRRIDTVAHDPALASFLAIALRDSAAMERALTALGNYEGDGIVVAASRVAMYARRIDVAMRISTLAVGPARRPHDRALGYRALASLAAARGRWQQARAYADSLRAVNPFMGREAQASLAIVPFSVYTHEDVQALRDSLRRPLSSSGVPAYRYSTGNFEAQESTVRLAAADGLLADRIGDRAGVRRSERVLEADRTIGAPQFAGWRRDRLGLLRADRLHAAGRTSEALEALTSVHAPDEAGSRDEERFRLGALARSAGRLTDAVRWFSSFEHITMESLAWSAPAHFARAEVLQQLGRRAEAAASYERVVELWADCDEPLRPMREEARFRAHKLRRQPPTSD